MAPATPWGRLAAVTRLARTRSVAIGDQVLERPYRSPSPCRARRGARGHRSSRHHAVGRHDHHERRGVVHERPEHRLVVARDLVGPTVGEVPDREDEGAVRGAGSWAPTSSTSRQPCCAEEPDLDRQADAACPARSAGTGRRCRRRRGARDRRPDIPTEAGGDRPKNSRRPGCPTGVAPRRIDHHHGIRQARQHPSMHVIALSREAWPRPAGEARRRTRRSIGGSAARIERGPSDVCICTQCPVHPPPGRRTGPCHTPLRRVGHLPLHVRTRTVGGTHVQPRTPLAGTNLTVLVGVLSRDAEPPHAPLGRPRSSPSSSPSAPRAAPPSPCPSPGPRRRSAASWAARARSCLVTGRVRRRFFRAGGTTQSRTEVVATPVVPTRRKARPAKALDAALASRADAVVTAWRGSAMMGPDRGARRDGWAQP